MTAPDSLGKQTSDSQLAVLLERSKNTERFIENVGHSLGGLNDTVNRIEKIQIQANESLTARSEANRTAITNLDAKVDHKDQSSIARDAQQVLMLREEEAARTKALEELEKRQEQRIAEIVTTIERMSVKLDNAVFWSRIMAGIASLAAIVGGAAFAAYLRTIFP